MNQDAPILIASDLSSRSDRPLDRALALAARNEVALILLHVVDRDGEEAAAREERLRNLAASDLAAFEGAEEEMRSFVALLPDELRRRIHARVEAEELQDMVEESTRGDAGLLVFGTHGRGGFAHAMIGSRAAELLVAATSDVLMVRGAS